MSKGFIISLCVIVTGVAIVLACPVMQAKLFGTSLCARFHQPSAPQGFILILKDVTDRAYATMMAHTNNQALLWKDRNTFTNYVLYVHYEEAVPVIEIQMTDAAGTHSGGYRFHTCVYDLKSHTMIFKEGLACCIED